MRSHLLPLVPDPHREAPEGSRLPEAVRIEAEPKGPVPPTRHENATVGLLNRYRLLPDRHDEGLSEIDLDDRGAGWRWHVRNPPWEGRPGEPR
jgi:hypothetical protein